MSNEIVTKLANPAPLGLLGIGMTTVLLNLVNAGVFPLDSDFGDGLGLRWISTDYCWNNGVQEGQYFWHSSFQLLWVFLMVSRAASCPAQINILNWN
jgi:hypothetical protein